MSFCVHRRKVKLRGAFFVYLFYYNLLPNCVVKCMRHLQRLHSIKHSTFAYALLGREPRAENIIEYVGTAHGYIMALLFQ